MDGGTPPGARTATPGLERRTPGRGRAAVTHALAVVLFFVAAAALFTYPLAFRPSKLLLAGGGDYYAEAAMLAWNARQVVQEPLHVLDLPFYYPYTRATAYQQSFFFPGLLAAPWLALTGQPLLVANGLVLASLVASGAFTYLLAFSMTRRVWPSLAAGVVFAFFSNRMDHLGQFTYQMGALLPLATWALSRFLVQGRWRHLGVLVASVWGQALSSLYHAFGLGLMLTAFTLGFALLRPRSLSRALAIKGLVGLVLLVVAVYPFLTPYLDVKREQGFTRDLNEAEWFGMDLLSLLDPGEFSTLYRGRLVSLHRAEGGLFPGWVALILVGVAVAGPWGSAEGGAERWRRGGRWTALVLAVVALVWITVVALRPGRRPDLTVPVYGLLLLTLGWVALEGRRHAAGELTSREWVALLTFVSLFAYLTTLAPTLKVADRPAGIGLFRWIHFYVPGGSAFRAPGRWSLAFALPLALLIAWGLHTLIRRWPRRGGRAAPLVLLAVMVESLPLPIPWVELPPTSAVYPWLREQPGDVAVVELPMATLGTDSEAMFWAIHHRKRLVNGGGGFGLPTVQAILEAMEPFDPDALLTALRAIYPLRYVVVHPQRIPAPSRARWQARPSLPGLRFVRGTGEVDLYELDATPERGIDLKRFFSSDYARRRRQADFTVRFDGDDPEALRWVEVSLNGRPLRRLAADASLTVELTAPLRRADRNEIRFLHGYRLRPDAPGREARRIGGTATYAPVDLEVVSGGKFSGNTVSIRVGGHEAVQLPRRGYHVVGLHPDDGRVLSWDHFDTFLKASESRRMASVIEGLAPGTIVAVAVKHDGGGQLTAEAVAALRAIGGREDLSRTLWQAHALVGVKGASPGEALEAREQAGGRPLRLALGRERALAVTLERFDLR